MLMASGWNAEKARWTGSLTTSSPVGTVTDRAPSKVTGVISETLAVPSADSVATVTSPNCAEASPKRLERWIRSTEAPRWGTTTIRRVWSSRTSGTGSPAASNGVSESVGLAVQLATQCSAGTGAAVAGSAVDRTTSGTTATSNAMLQLPQVRWRPRSAARARVDVLIRILAGKRSLSRGLAGVAAP